LDPIAFVDCPSSASDEDVPEKLCRKAKPQSLPTPEPEPDGDFSDEENLFLGGSDSDEPPDQNGTLKHSLSWNQAAKGSRGRTRHAKEWASYPYREATSLSLNLKLSKSPETETFIKRMLAANIPSNFVTTDQNSCITFHFGSW